MSPSPCQPGEGLATTEETVPWVFPSGSRLTFSSDHIEQRQQNIGADVPRGTSAPIGL
jgi:hypothetical protein